MLQLCFGEIGEAPGLGFKPLVDLRLGSDALVNVARLLAQIKHHTVPHSFVKLIGMDVSAKDLDAPLFVSLQ